MLIYKYLILVVVVVGYGGGAPCTAAVPPPLPLLLLNFNLHMYFVGAAVSFINLIYIVNENGGLAQIVLLLSSEVSYTVTLDVINSGGVATGE